MKNSCRNIICAFVAVIVFILLVFVFLAKNVKAEKELVCVPDTIVASYISCNDDTVVIMKSNLDSLINEYNKSVREIERKNSLRVEQKLESVNTNLSIWLAIIAAICTLLPLVSTLYQANLWEKTASEMENKNKKNSECINSMEKKLKDVEKKINESEEKFSEKSKHEEFISSLGILESTIRILCEYQDLQSRNRLALADRTFIDNLCSTIGNLSNLCKKYSQNHSLALDCDQVTLVKSSILMAFNSFSNLLVVLETISPAESLINILAKKDELRNNIQILINNAKVPKSEKQEIDSQIHYLGSFASQMIDILKECLKQRDK